MSNWLGNRLATGERDAGVYAVLYAVLVTVIFGMSAFVVDLSMLRLDRSTDRSVADSAAVAAAGELLDQGPRVACTTGFSYASTNLDTTFTPDCFVFPASVATCPDAPIEASAVAGDVTVTIGWPVPDTDPAMTSPDVRPGDVSQALISADGGSCGRLRVSVGRPRSFTFGKVLGVAGGSTLSTSVALAYANYNGGDKPAPLVVLDTASCDALNVNGGSQLLIAHATTKDPVTGAYDAGRIVVDSDGSGGDVGCNGAGSTTIDSSSNAYIRAQDGIAADGSEIPARIESFALSGSHADKAYKTSDTAGCVPSTTDVQGTLCPVPTAANARVGEAPFDNRYNCLAANHCPDVANDDDTSRAYIQQFTNFALTKPYASYTGGCSTPGSGTTVIEGPIVVDCPGGFTINNTTVFTGNVVVFTGDVATKGNGTCMEFDVDKTIATTVTCSTLATTAGSLPRQHPETLVYVAGGLHVPSNTTIVAPQTTFVVRGVFDIGGTAYFSAPYDESETGFPCALATPGQPAFASCFEDLVLWDDYVTPTSSPHRLAGGGAFHVDGSLYMPKGQFIFTGNTAGTQTSAQFVAKRVEITGGGQLMMVPDSDRQTTIPESAAALIR